MRTLEQRLKFDHGLKIGINLVEFSHNGRNRLAVVEISPRGVVKAFAKPEPSDMYAGWFRIKGDVTTTKGMGVYSWPAKNPDIMSWFKGTPTATVELVK
jgi:hypothetical protein